MKKICFHYISLPIFIACVLHLFISDLKAQVIYKVPLFEDNFRLEKIRQTFVLVDSIYKDIAVRNNYPGLAYGIVVDGKLVHTGNYGFTDLKNKVPVTSSSMFRIASMSKSVTAMAILHLRDQGRLDLDDPVEKYIPEMKNQNYLAIDAPIVTIRHCLTHNAGFPEDNPWGDRQLQDTDEELSDLLSKKISFSNVPDAAYEYSNLGFALLGRIITKVSGIQYQQFIKQNILKPLNMPETNWEYDLIDKKFLALGYRWLDGKYQEEELLHDSPNGSWGAMGAMISSVDEFAKYVAFHLSAWPSRSDKEIGPISRNAVREMHKPWNFSGFNPNHKYPDGRPCATANAYGYGMRWTQDCENKIYVGHSGGLPGFGSHWHIMPDYGIGVISLANRTYAGTSSVNLKVVDAIVMKAGLKPRTIQPSDILKNRKDQLMAMLPDWENAEKSNIFAENFFPDFIHSLLQNQSRTMFRKAGKIIKVHEIVPENQLRGTFLIEGANINMKVYFTLSPENPPKIQDYRLIEIQKD